MRVVECRSPSISIRWHRSATRCSSPSTRTGRRSSPRRSTSATPVGGGASGALAGRQDPRPPRRAGAHVARDQHHHRVSAGALSGRARCCPTTGARLDARLWDRFFDLYVSVPMQKIVTDRLRPEAARDPRGWPRRTRRSTPPMRCGSAARPGPGPSASGFTIADCAAAPGLFFAAIVHPFGARHCARAYFERLLARPSLRRTLD